MSHLWHELLPDTNNKNQKKSYLCIVPFLKLLSKAEAEGWERIK